MGIYHRFVENVTLRRWTVLGFIIVILWLVRSQMSKILLTFIFTFLVLRLIHFVQRHVRIPSRIIVITVYVLIILALYFAITIYLPKVATQVVATVQSIYKFYQSSSSDTNATMRWVADWVGKSNIMPQVKSGIKILMDYLTSIGSFGVTFVLSLILSFFFTIEEKPMKSFSKLFLSSDYGWFFQDVYYFAHKFSDTFGVVLEAQFIIAICNTVVTTIGLAFMHMPQLLVLAIMIFILSLVPVAGVIISAIPLSLIGYSVGGIRDVVYILILLVIVHTLEAYVLNPKLMSSKTELPIFYTFVVLLAGEAIWGTWGLIVAVPVFTFFLDILGVKRAHGLHVPPAQFQQLKEQQLKRFKNRDWHHTKSGDSGDDK
ncbi:AI-2E family transporter [Secundilactobacillus collinoides]|uniref:Permease n=2 Tax=Secundilactobacillus collinoides TaxID=33960 RepID=A0A0R2BCQ6_SECCO|nr:AI-2E family transporter [Secundilactobacillus collinoides]KRM76855.1 permease [Secundilactobacillus collinoides DSM 20515 = JCM 1123]KZL36705.1 membrane protein [Secundilactobacillus collinoides]